MSKCKQCGVIHTNGSKFCTKKCRKKWVAFHDIKYKKMMKSWNDDYLLEFGITGRGSFDIEGNSV